MAAGAGPLREILAFDKRVEIDDGFGNTEGEWQEQFRCPASATAMTKGQQEAVIAARLTGVQPWLVVVRNFSETRQVTTGWRARNTRTGEAYNITTVAARPMRDYIDMTCTSGQAQ